MLKGDDRVSECTHRSAGAAERSIVLAAGQALIAASEGTGSRYAGMPLAWLAGLIISVVMLRSNTFSKATAWAGILGLGLLVASTPFAGYTTTGATAAVVSAIIAVTYLGGGLLSLAWCILSTMGQCGGVDLADRGCGQGCRSPFTYFEGIAV